MPVVTEAESIDNPLVAVARNKYRRAVWPPGYKGETWDWRCQRDRVANSRQVRAEYDVMPVRAVVAKRFASDAHMVAYTMYDPDGERLKVQPRIAKAALPWLLEQGYRVVTRCFVVDIDNPGHRAWTEEDRERAEVEQRTIPMLQSTGCYWTRSGRRIIQPLLEELDAALSERCARAYLLELERAGVFGVDMGCRDWTRHMRSAHILREGRYVPPELVDLERMRAIAPPPPVDAVPRSTRKRTRGTVAVDPSGEISWSVEVPPAHRQLVLDVADGFRAREDEWHKPFLALAGAMAERGVAPEHIPAIVVAVSIETKADDRPEARDRGARDTVRKWQEGYPVMGLRTLRALDPRLAGIIERHTARGAEAGLHQQVEQAQAGATPPTELEAATTGMQRAIRDAFGVVGIEAGCGLGKSQAALAIAKERSEKGYATEDAKGLRAPAGSKTAISCPTNQLAEQHTMNLRAKGVKVLRVFGPLSVKRPDGKPECRYHDAASHLVEGGQPMAWELCEGRKKNRCQYWDDCTARGGLDGPGDARVIIGPHAKLGAMTGEAGTTGMVIIDEPPPPIETLTFSLSDFDNLLRREDSFGATYWTVLAPIVQACRWALGHADPTPADEPRTMTSLIRSGWDGVKPEVIDGCLDAAELPPLEGDDDPVARIVSAQVNALHHEAKSHAPPLRRQVLELARRYASTAKLVGAASKLLFALWRAVTQTPAASARVVEFAGKRNLVLALLATDYLSVLQRDAPTVLLDASLEQHLPVASVVTGYTVPVHRFRVADGAPTERTVWLEPRARRKHWLRDGWPAWEEGLLAAIERIVAWTGETPWVRSAAIISVKPVADVLRVALGGQIPDGMPGEVVEQANRLVRPLLNRAKCVWSIGHYGALRGLDTMSGVDALATLMDPVPNINTAQHDVAYYNLDLDWEDYLNALIRAELEQAHGRVRLPHRRAAVRLLHVGVTLPGGYGWDRPEVKISRDWLRRGLPPMTAAELDHLRGENSVAAYAKLLGLTERTLYRYLDGTRAVPEHVAAAARRVGAGRATS